MHRKNCFKKYQWCTENCQLQIKKTVKSIKIAHQIKWTFQSSRLQTLINNLKTQRYDYAQSNENRFRNYGKKSHQIDWGTLINRTLLIWELYVVLYFEYPFLKKDCEKRNPEWLSLKTAMIVDYNLILCSVFFYQISTRCLTGTGMYVLFKGHSLKDNQTLPVL